MPDESFTNGEWRDWRRYIIEALEDIRKEQKIQITRIDTLRVDLAVLKVKAGLWGSLAGVIATIVVVGLDYLIREHH